MHKVEIRVYVDGKLYGTDRRLSSQLSFTPSVKALLSRELSNGFKFLEREIGKDINPRYNLMETFFRLGMFK